MTRTLEGDIREAIEQARSEAAGYASQMGTGLEIRLKAIEDSLFALARVLDNAWSKLSETKS